MRQIGVCTFCDHPTAPTQWLKRYAPERKFPAGLDDCVFAARWAAARRSRDSSRSIR
jgi:hypothetical protein